MDDVISPEIIKKSIIKCNEETRINIQEYLHNKYSNISNIILDNLPVINSGLSINEYLCRMMGWNLDFREPPNKQAMMIKLEQLCNKLMTVQSNQTSKLSIDDIKEDVFNKQIQKLRFICQLALNGRTNNHFVEWLNAKKSNVILLNEALNSCLKNFNFVLQNKKDFLAETCYTIGVLARTFRLQIKYKIHLVLNSLIYLLAKLMNPYEQYTKQYREAIDNRNLKNRHYTWTSSSLNLAQFRWNFNQNAHRLIGCIYFTLADLIHSCPIPNLIVLLARRSFKRKEMCRHLLFNILYTIVLKYDKLKEEAELLSKSKSVQANPISNTNQQNWNNLPGNLYMNLLRVYNESNHINKYLILEMLSMLKSQAWEKLPTFEESPYGTIDMQEASNNMIVRKLSRITMGPEITAIAAIARLRKSVIRKESLNQHKSSIHNPVVSYATKIASIDQTIGAEDVNDSYEDDDYGTSESEASCYTSKSMEHDNNQHEIRRKTPVSSRTPGMNQLNRLRKMA